MTRIHCRQCRAKSWAVGGVEGLTRGGGSAIPGCCFPNLCCRRNAFSSLWQAGRKIWHLLARVSEGWPAEEGAAALPSLDLQRQPQETGFYLLGDFLTKCFKPLWSCLQLPCPISLSRAQRVLEVEVKHPGDTQWPSKTQQPAPAHPQPPAGSSLAQLILFQWWKRQSSTALFQLWAR